MQRTRHITYIKIIFRLLLISFISHQPFFEYATTQCNECVFMMFRFSINLCVFLIIQIRAAERCAQAVAISLDKWKSSYLYILVNVNNNYYTNDNKLINNQMSVLYLLLRKITI